MNSNTTLSFKEAHRQSDCSVDADTLAAHPWISGSGEVADAYGINSALSDDDVIKRAVERVSTGVNNGTIAKPRTVNLATEYLSYPVARIIISYLDDQRLINRYIDAEADHAIGVLESSLWHPSVDFDAHAIFDEFGIDADEQDAYQVLSEERHKYASMDSYSQTIFRIPFEQYLEVSSDINDDSWRLVNRGVEAGFVHIYKHEVVTFLRAAIELRVGEKLPVPVPDEIGDSVEKPVSDVQNNIDKDLFTKQIDRVEEGLYPPVIKSLLTDFPHKLSHDNKVTLASFLLQIGMTPNEVVQSLGVVGTPGEDPTRKQVNHIWNGGDPYMPANYDTIQTRGYDWKKDSLEKKVANPLSYYRIKLDEDSQSGAFNWMEVYDENVSPMLTFPAGMVSMEMEDNQMPDGFAISDDGATWTCDDLGNQFATGLALVAVVEQYIDAEAISMTFLKEIDPTEAVEICVDAVVKYDVSRKPPSHILTVIGEVYGFEFVDGGNYLSKIGKRDAQNAFHSLVEEAA